MDFLAKEYRKIIKDFINEGGPKSRGQMSRIGEYLGVHSSLVSQILGGTRDLTFDQACTLCEFMNLSTIESDYFIALVQEARAGNEAARKRCRGELEKIRARASKLKEHVTKDKELTSLQNATYYSAWYFVAIKQLLALEEFQTVSAIAQKLNLSLAIVKNVLQFFEETGLCKHEKGKYIRGPTKIHIPSDDPLVGRHHINWRTKGFEQLGMRPEEELFFTLIATLSSDDKLRLREEIRKAIKKVVQVVDSSEPKELICFNVDFFGL